MSLPESSFFTFYLKHFNQDYLSINEVNKYGIVAYGPAKELGLQTGDKIIALNGKTPERFRDMRSTKVFLGKSITVDRNGQIIKLPIPGDFFNKIKEPYFIEPKFNRISVLGVADSSFAKEAGLMPKDRFVSVKRTKILKDFRNFKIF